MVPPLLLLAMPAWLARLIILEDGLPQRILRFLTKPIVAGIIFNALQVLTHWGTVVDLSVENGAFHYGIHLLVFASALLMWFPVLGPLPEMQMSEPGKMLYLFLMSMGTLLILRCWFLDELVMFTKKQQKSSIEP